MSPTPQAPLQFNCPACGAVLTVTATIAGMQGPCPKCWQEIISPDPANGLPPRLPAPPQPASPIFAPEPEPTPAPEPLLPPEPEPEPEPAIPPEAVTPPPPEHPPAPPAPRRKRKVRVEDDDWDKPSRSKATLLIAIGVPVLALAAVGYYFGKDYLRPVAGPASPGLPLEPPPAMDPAAAPAPTPDETGQGLQPPPSPELSQEDDAQNVLIAFLGAPDWQSRSAFVLYPDETRPEMEKHAKEQGDGPITASAISFLKDQSVPNVSVFKVCTKAMPEGFPVPVVLTDEGPKIDWESFTAFNDDHFNKLLKSPAGQSGIFNLLVKPETGEEPSPHWVRYRLSAPMPGRHGVAWVRRDSVAFARIKAVLDGASDYNKETVEQYLSGDGIPLRLAVSKRMTNDGREFVEVEDMVAVSWAPPRR